MSSAGIPPGSDGVFVAHRCIARSSFNHRLIAVKLPAWSEASQPPAIKKDEERSGEVRRKFTKKTNFKPPEMPPVSFAVHKTPQPTEVVPP